MSVASELERFRDHCREMAAWKVGKACEKCAGNHNPWTVTTWREPDHDACQHGDCRCSCTKPSKAERTLWKHLAAEVDAYLSTDEDEGLFA